MTDLTVREIHSIMDSLTTDDVVTEYSKEYSTGDLLLLEENEDYPVAQRMVHGKRFGSKYYTRRILVLTDWEEA